MQYLSLKAYEDRQSLLVEFKKKTILQNANDEHVLLRILLDIFSPKD